MTQGPRIVEAEELHAQLDRASPAANAVPDLILAQVTSAEVFNQAHLPHANLVQPQQLMCGIPPASGRIPDEAAIGRMLAGMNYDADAEIVVYDDEGGGWAGRLAWTLDVIGHTRWTYLNGGMQAWQHAGYAFEQGPPPANNSANVPVTFDSGPIAEIEDVYAAIEDPEQVIWDVRSAQEYAGLKSSSARAGHIPGAINLDWMMLKDPGRQLRLTVGIEDELKKLGLMQASSIITHCQTHHRSGLSYMLGRLLGLPIRAYHGSWSEWGNREDTPIETGAN